MIRTSLVAAVVVVVAVIAAVDAFRSRAEAPRAEAPAPAKERRPALEGPDVPPPAALPGTLHFATLSDCRLGSLDLERVELGEPGPRTACGLAVSPDGRYALVGGDHVTAPSTTPPPREPNRELWLARVGREPELVRRLGIVHGPVVDWAPDGRRVAWCGPDGETVVLELGTGRRETVAGCRPRFAPDGSLLTRPDRVLAAELYRDGRRLLATADLAAGVAGASRTPRPGLVTGALTVLGYDQAADGTVAVALMHFKEQGGETVVELWRDGARLRTLLLPAAGDPTAQYRFGDRVDFSPGGAELALAYPGYRVRQTLVDARSGRTTLADTVLADSDWSPDGRWLAVATGEDIRIYGPGRAGPAYVLPVPAVNLAWR